MTSRGTPLARFRTSIIAEIPSSRLPRYMLSVASSSEKRVDVGSRGSIHRSGDSPRVGERLPPDTRAKGDLPLVLSTTVTMLGDPPTVSPSVQPASGAVAWAAGGTDCVAPSDTTVAASGYAWLVMVMATYACDARASTCSAPPHRGCRKRGWQLYPVQHRRRSHLRCRLLGEP